MTQNYSDKPAHDAITRARSTLLIDAPFFGTLTMRLNMVEDPSRNTLSVDGKNLFYNPAFVKEQGPKLLQSALAHEVLHCALEHCGHGRNIGKDPNKWNHAADYATNSILKESGFELGEGWLYNAQFRDMTAEAIYNLIPDPPPGNGKAPSKDNPGPIDQCLPGEPNQDPSQVAKDKTDWKVATMQAAAAAKAMGKLSGTLERFIDEALKPQVAWQDVLRAALDTIAKNDYSFARPNHKMLAAGYYLPGLYSEEVDTIDVGVDESGSISQAELAVFSREIKTIFEDVNPRRIRVWHFSAGEPVLETFNNVDEFALNTKVSGGTDFVPVFDAIENSGEPPATLVMLTDMYGSFPDHAPEYPVVWCATSEVKAPFGETIHVDIQGQS